MSDKELQRLTDELEIRNVVARLALLADTGDLDEYVGLFTEDAVWDFPLGPRSGRADIRTGAEERRQQKVTGPGSSSRHLISTVSVDVQGAESATADSYFQFFKETATSPSLFNMGHYHDTFRREHGTWRLAQRKITLG